MQTRTSLQLACRAAQRVALVASLLALGLFEGGALSVAPLHAVRPVLVHPTDTRDVFLMVDNRALNPSLLSGATWALAAVVNAHYARRHGYRFVYAIPVYNESRVPATAAAAAALCALDGGATAPGDLEGRVGVLRGTKDRVAAFHFGLAVRRYAPWAKLLPAWSLTRAGTNVFYADSDLIVEDDSRSLADVFSGGAYKELRAGVNASDALVAFLADTPFGPPKFIGERVLCSGAFLAFGRRQPRAASAWLRQWWDLPGWEQGHAYEQGALYKKIYAPQPPNCSAATTSGCLPAPCGGAVDMAHTYALLGDDPFMHQRKNAWLQHYGSLESHSTRERAFLERLTALGFVNDSSFAAAVEDIVPLHFDVLELALLMHAESCDAAAACQRSAGRNESTEHLRRAAAGGVSAAAGRRD